VAEGGGLLNRYRVKSSIGGSNPPLSAIETSDNIRQGSMLNVKTPANAGVFLFWLSDSIR